MKLLKLREDVALKFEGRACEIHGPRGLKLLDLNPAQLALIRKLWQDGVPMDTPLESREERALLATLARKRLLRRFEPDYTRDEVWLSHYVEDARASLRALGEKTVAILGCGGTGAIIADHLARAGVKKFILIDGARLDAPDLNRQWPFSRSDIGSLKAEALAAHLSGEFGAQSVTHSAFIESPADLPRLAQRPDLIVCCADKPRYVIELLALEYAETHDCALLFGAVGIEDDKVGPLVIGEKERAMEREFVERSRSYGAETRVVTGSVCFTNTLAAGKIGQLAYHHLLGLEAGSFQA